MTNAAIYCRISDDRRGDAAGVRRQEADCRALCEARGWAVAEVFVDNDTSAYSGKRRPSYARLLDLLKEGRLDAVVAWHPDRLHRSPKELEAFIDVIEASGAEIATIKAGTYDLSNATGRMTARIVGATARYESELKSERTSRQALDAARAGRVSGGGSRPFGFEADRRTLRPDEASAIRDAARRVLAGEALRSLCMDFDGRNIRTIGEKAWHPSSMRRMLMSARISGQREHRGEIVAAAQWPAIITAEQTTRLRAVLGDARRRTAHTPTRYLLAGMLRCALCEATLVSRPTAEGRRRYVCAKGPGYHGCGRMYIVADELEALIAEAVLYRLDTPELLDRLARRDDPHADEHQATLDSATAQQGELAAAYGRQQITLNEWLAARAPIEARLDSARRALSRLAGTAALDDYLGDTDALRTSWDTLALLRRRAIISAVLDHVIIGSGVRGLNRFDPRRVTPVWKV